MCKSQPLDDKLSLIGAWSGNVTHYKILQLVVMQRDARVCQRQLSYLFIMSHVPAIEMNLFELMCLACYWHIN